MSRQNNQQSESAAMDQAIQHQASSPPPPSVAPCPLQHLTWIEICLLDTEGNPVSGIKYRISDPAGNVHEGLLDSEGKVRVNGLKPGDCSISFPTLDEAAWEWV